MVLISGISRFDKFFLIDKWGVSDVPISISSARMSQSILSMEMSVTSINGNPSANNGPKLDLIGLEEIPNRDLVLSDDQHISPTSIWSAKNVPLSQSPIWSGDNIPNHPPIWIMFPYSPPISWMLRSDLLVTTCWPPWPAFWASTGSPSSPMLASGGPSLSLLLFLFFSFSANFSLNKRAPFCWLELGLFRITSAKCWNWSSTSLTGSDPECSTKNSSGRPNCTRPASANCWWMWGDRGWFKTGFWWWGWSVIDKHNKTHPNDFDSVPYTGERKYSKNVITD